MNVRITPWHGSAGYLCCPREDSPAQMQHPVPPGWERMACPVCGDGCYVTPAAREALKTRPDLQLMCTRCALKAGLAKAGDSR